MLDDNAELSTVSCKMGHKVRITIGQARRSGEIRCRVCGQAIKIDGTDLQRKLRDVERALDDLRKTLEHP